MTIYNANNVKITIGGVDISFNSGCESDNSKSFGVRSSTSLNFKDPPSGYFEKISMRCDIKTKYLINFYLTGNRPPRGMR